MSFWFLDDEKKLVKVALEELAEYLDKQGDPRQQVGLDQPILGVTVSTAFLGMDVSGRDGQRPCCFETFISSINNREIDGIQERYYSWDEALAGHAKWCDWVIDRKD